MTELAGLLMPPGLTLAVVLGLLAVSFAASLITVAFGIGGGAVLLAFMATLVPPAILIPVHGVVQAGSNFGRMITLFRHISWQGIPMFALGSGVGVIIGGAVAVNIPPWAVQVSVGLFIIWSVFARPPQWMRRWAAVTGAISSFLTMFFGATGTFVAAYTKALRLERFSHVATHATLMTVQHGLKSVAFGFLGFAFGPWLPLTVAMIVIGFAGTLVGKLVLDKLSERRFGIALNAVLLLTATKLIWSGISAFGP